MADLKFNHSQPVHRKAIYSDDPIWADVFARLDALDNALDIMLNSLPEETVDDLADQEEAREAECHVNSPPEEDELDAEVKKMIDGDVAPAEDE